MKAIILCAGKGKRLESLTKTTPKVLVEVNKKTLLEYKLDLLNQINNQFFLNLNKKQNQNFIDEVILVVNYKKEMIKTKFGNSYKNLKLTYITQKNMLGTGDAIFSTKEKLKNYKGKLLILNGDDIYSLNDIKNLIKNQHSILGKEVENISSFGILEFDKNNNLTQIIEKPTYKTKSNLANIGAYYLSNEIFNFSIKKSSRGEYEITDLINEFIKNTDINIKIKKIENSWFPINNLEQLEIANNFFGGN